MIKQITPEELLSIKANPKPSFKATKILKQIEDLKAMLKTHQDLCKHDVKHRYIQSKSSTGHYDPSDDSYWDEHYCARCHKIWTTDQVYVVGATEVSEYAR